MTMSNPYRPTRASKAVSVSMLARKKYVKQLNRRGSASRETGFVDLGLATYACDTTGSVTLIPTIAQGASVNQRVGKKVLLKGLMIRGHIRSNTTTTLAEAAVLLVYDKRPQGALPGVADILVSASPDAMNNDANSGRFQIVRRWDYTLIGNITTPTIGREQQSFEKYVDLKNRPLYFKAAGTGAIGDIEQGALYLVTVGNIAPGTAAASFVAGFRTRFIDV